MSYYSQVDLDFYDNPKMIKSFGEIPSFVKKSCPTSRTSLEKQGSDNFSLVIISPDGGIYSKYPVNDPANIWLSLQAFEKNAFKLPVKMQETAAYYLNKAANEWGGLEIPEKIQKLASQNNPSSNVVEAKSNDEYYVQSVKEATEKFESFNEKVASTWFALETDEQGKELKTFPLYTAELTKTADAWFESNFRQLRPMLRKQYTDNLIKAASRHGLVLNSKNIFKYANQDFSPGVEIALQVRKHYTLDENNIHLLNDIMEKKASLSPYQFAETLEKVDKFLGLDKYWNNALPDPYESTFSMPKQADYSYAHEGSDVTGSELREFVKSKNFRETLQAYVAKDIIDELQMNPIEVFDSLPNPEKKLIMDLMKES